MSGASPNTIDANGYNSLQLVVNGSNDKYLMKKKLQLVRLLLHFNVNLDLADVNGQMATHNLAQNCNAKDKLNLFMLFYLLEARENQASGSALKHLAAPTANGHSLEEV